MVSQKYRWDFIGLSTDTKPTSETSEKVVNGSTYYCSDTSKLYVYCDGTWYERKPLGGGGGGGTSDFNDLSNRPKYNDSDMTGSTNIPEVKTYTAGSNVTISDQNVISATNTTYTAGSNVAISDQNVISATDTTYTAGTNVSISDQNVISATDTTYSAFTGTDGTAAGTAGLVPAPATTDAGKFLSASGIWEAVQGGGGGGVTELTSADYNWPTNNPNGVAIWKLDTGIYTHAEGVKVYYTSSINNSQSCLFALHNNEYQTSCLRIRGAEADMQYFDVNNASGGVREHFYISQTVDNLTSSSEYAPLSANQGKVLNNKITPSSGASAPTTSTVGELGKIYIDTSTDEAYMCTKVNGSTYTWKQITA